MLVVSHAFWNDIDNLEEFVFQIAKEEGDNLDIGTFTLLLPIYANDVVFFAYSVLPLHNLLYVVHAFCDATGLSINVRQTKVLTVHA